MPRETPDVPQMEGRLTEAFDLERRPPLDDGASADPVERLAAALFEEFAHLLDSSTLQSVHISCVASRFGRRGPAGVDWHVSFGGVMASGATIAEAVANARAKTATMRAKRPTTGELAATLGLEVPAND